MSEDRRRLGDRGTAWSWLLLVAIAAAPGCARARASAEPGGPPLNMPAPPPRVIVPLQVEVDEPVEELPAVAQEPARPPARPRPAPPEVPARPTEAPKVADEAPRQTTPPTVLQTTPAAQQGEAERAIRATMVRASADLNRIDYRALNADARTQYDTAKRFIEQAEDAIRMKNLPFAKNLADKAGVLATQLAAQ